MLNQLAPVLTVLRFFEPPLRLSLRLPLRVADGFGLSAPQKRRKAAELNLAMLGWLERLQDQGGAAFFLDTQSNGRTRAKLTQRLLHPKTSGDGFEAAKGGRERERQLDEAVGFRS